MNFIASVAFLAIVVLSGTSSCDELCVVSEDSGSCAAAELVDSQYSVVLGDRYFYETQVLIPENVSSTVVIGNAKRDVIRIFGDSDVVHVSGPAADFEFGLAEPHRITLAAEESSIRIGHLVSELNFQVSSVKRIQLSLLEAMNGRLNIIGHSEVSESRIYVWPTFEGSLESTFDSIDVLSSVSEETNLVVDLTGISNKLETVQTWEANVGENIVIEFIDRDGQ